MHNLYLKSDISSDVSNNVQHSYDCIKLLLDETIQARKSWKLKLLLIYKISFITIKYL